MPLAWSSPRAALLWPLKSQGKDKSWEPLLHNSSTPHELLGVCHSAMWWRENCNRRWTLIGAIVPGLLLAFISIDRPGPSYYHGCTAKERGGGGVGLFGFYPAVSRLLSQQTAGQFPKSVQLLFSWRHSHQRSLVARQSNRVLLYIKDVTSRSAVRPWTQAF